MAGSARGSGLAGSMQDPSRPAVASWDSFGILADPARPVGSPALDIEDHAGNHRPGRESDIEPRIKNRFTPALRREVATRYGLSPDALSPLDGFESFIYRIELLGRPAILRVGHSDRRGVHHVRGEVDWMRYLAAREISVALPLLSPSGNLVETVPDGHDAEFVATAFRHARGRPPKRQDWAPPLWERYGRLLARIHEATLGYQPADPAWRRPEWDDNDMTSAFAFLPPDEPAVRRSLDAVLAHLGSLPRDRDHYGLVHQDAHGANLFVDDDGTLTLFDFDDCCYTWLVNDIAIVVFYAVSWGHVEDADRFAAEFWRHFRRGYESVRPLQTRWLAEIPWFLKLREIDTYAAIHRSLPAVLEDPWTQRFLRGRRKRLRDEVPYLNSDFTADG